jgi:hypothetical protein
MDYLTTHRSLSPIRRGVVPGFVIYNLENKYAPALDNYEQSCFVRSDFLKMKCVCPAISSYSFGATALIFCRMFMHIMEVCMSTGF